MQGSGRFFGARPPARTPPASVAFQSDSPASVGVPGPEEPAVDPVRDTCPAWSAFIAARPSAAVG